MDASASSGGGRKLAAQWSISAINVTESIRTILSSIAITQSGSLTLNISSSYFPSGAKVRACCRVHFNIVHVVVHYCGYYKLFG